MRRLLGAALALFVMPAFASASDNAELAKKLSNPVSSLISVPFQFNYDCCFGPKNGHRMTINVQPVVPLKLSPDWNLIVRTILPLVQQDEPFPGAGDHFGLSDTTQSFFFSPATSHGGVIWGAGPAFLWPTATDHALGSRKWGAGPTAIVLRQDRGWTYGLLANHIWSYAGKVDRPGVSSTFLQPFLSHTWPDTTTLTLNAETSYDWKAEQWSVPLNLTVSHIYKLGRLPVSLQVGARYYAARFGGGTPRWGMRSAVVFLLPE